MRAMETYHVHIHPENQSNNESLPPDCWNACMAKDRHSAITAVLTAYDAQEYKPSTVFTLHKGEPGKIGSVVERHGLEWQNE